ncbi:Hsp20/alpha crystallin family protein [Candidatus Uhrbacteria bacterium]|jgi:HSP20 family protein|nr:Hsp20/alpha crystallin family protein [Candidatus Uhrbacteria bacterium]HJN85465.1 Hsp20/alpha crystallin family protein [Patescibacteria group bacterium]
MDGNKLSVGTKQEDWPDVAEGQLSVDIFETDNDLVVQSAIAGVKAEDLDIYVNADMVTVRGSRQRDSRMETATMHYEECFWGAFSRTIILPAHVSATSADAELKDGVLTITLPKANKGGISIPVKD